LTVNRWSREAVHWRDGNQAYISLAFTWQLQGARRIAEYYRSLGCHVRAGGPGTFTRPKYLADLCTVGGSMPDAIARHNPAATRSSYGCPVGCWFCIVPKMDGRRFTLIPEFTPRPILCDDNLSALPADYQCHVIDRYKRAGVPLLDANSGFEPATFDRDVFERWRPILKGPWRFGYDESTEGENVARAFRVLRDVRPRLKQVYTMIGHEPFALCMERIGRVIDNGGEPYAQPFIKLNALTKTPAIRHDWTLERLRQVQRWVNRRLWRVIPFADYDANARRQPDRHLTAA
jgi:hypothetical protein